MKLEFRTLRADEIECRPATITEKGVSLLLYKDARCDMNILDDHPQIGAMNWQRDHKELKGNIYCGVSIYDSETGAWSTKWDCGKESNQESEKGEASDSFNRACFNWGIGRELYTAPFIWIKAEDTKIAQGRSGKFQCNDSFYVEQILYEGKTIVALSIKSKAGKRVFMMDKRKKDK